MTEDGVLKIEDGRRKWGKSKQAHSRKGKRPVVVPLAAGHPSSLWLRRDEMARHAEDRDSEF